MHTPGLTPAAGVLRRMVRQALRGTAWGALAAPKLDERRRVMAGNDNYSVIARRSVATTKQSSARESAPNKKRGGSGKHSAFCSAPAGARLDCFAIGVRSTPFFERLWLTMTAMPRRRGKDPLRLRGPYSVSIPEIVLPQLRSSTIALYEMR